MSHQDLAAIARELEKQEAILASLNARALAHGDAVLQLSDEVDAQLGEVVERLSRRTAVVPRFGLRA